MNIVYILLGWLLGILSPGITSRIANHYKKTAIQRIIIEELKDTKKRLAGVPLRVYPSYGDLDVRHFEWVKEQTNNFTDFMSNDNEKEKYKELSKQDVNIENVVKSFNAYKITNDPAFHFKKIEMGIINSNQINFEILDNQFLTKILEIGFHVRVYNEEVQSVYEYLKMTFDSTITETNLRVIKDEIKRKNYIISEKAIFIVEKINQTIQISQS